MREIDDDKLRRLLIEAATDYAIYAIDPEGRIASWTAGAERITGYGADEILGQDFDILFTEDDRREGRPAAELRAARDDGRFQIEGWRVRKDASRFWAQSTLHALRDTDGRFIGFAKVTRDLTERRAAEQAVADSEQQFRLLVNGLTNAALYMLSPDGTVASWNVGAERIKGYRAPEILGQHFGVFYTPEDRERGAPEATLAAAAAEGRFETEAWRVRKDGSRFWAAVAVEPVRDAAGTLLGFAKITQDISERLRASDLLEEARSKAAQSQRLEAIGKLTGGIAHDFNNHLQVIVSNLEFIGDRVGGDAELSQRVHSATTAAEHSASLTRRLLAFARRQPLQPRVVNLSKSIQGMAELLRQSLGEKVELESLVSGGLWNTVVDVVELENALVNLAVNARDAMPDGGNLTIEIGNAFLDHQYARQNPEAEAGQYVVIAVSDTGTGMSPEQTERAFEPFYTTKGEGRGTGLGLSQVHGFIKQSGGHIKLYSEPGAGTTVKIYLPRSGKPEALEPTAVTAEMAGRGECILVVEDDPAVRRSAVDMVAGLGYRALQAEDGKSALAILRSGAPVNVLFTDIVMPGPMNGRELSLAAEALMPGIAVLFTSGYTENAIIHNGQLDDGILLLSKPYNRQEMAIKLRMAIDQAARRTDGPPPRAGTGAARPRVLLVEDDALLRASVAGVLRRMGCTVAEAGSAETALEAAGDGTPLDVLVTDMSLPGMTGTSLIEALRRGHPGLAAILMTGRPPETLPPRTSLLPKPFVRSQLSDALAALGWPERMPD
ncbi:MAG: PAS domain S-box protein [Alphaproteobacteria bacterium]|nr:PAS domain S-box protein [Alphaproteobacteria bacterium]